MLKKYLYLFVAGIRTLLMVLSMLIYIIIYVLSLPFKKHTKERAFALRRSYVKLATKILGIKMEVKGQMHDQPALYASNHRSFSDPIIVSIFIDAFVIAKAEVSSFPLINKGAELTGVIYVKREDKDSRGATRKMMVDIINSGYNVLVYPEGTVNYKSQTMPYHKGTFIEAAKHGIPVVPIALEYRDESDLWYKANFLKHMFKQFGKAHTYIKLEIGPAMQDEDGIVLSEKVEAWTNKKIIEMNKNWSTMFTYPDQENNPTTR